MQNANCKLSRWLPLAVLLFGMVGCGSPSSTSSSNRLTEPPAIDLSPLDVRVRDAIEEAQKGVRDDPGSAAKWGELGKLLLAHEWGTEAALACLAQAEQRQTTSPEWPYLQGVWLARVDAERGIAKLRRAVELGGDEEWTARMRLAETLAAEEQWDAARQEAKYVLARSPASGRALLLLGRIALSEGKPREAVEALEKAAGDRAARPAAEAMLAEAKQRLGESDGRKAAPAAVGGIGRAVAWPDRYVDSVTALRRGLRAELAAADGLLAQNRSKEALAAIEATLGRYPDSGWAWLLSGRARLQLGDAGKAQADLRRSIELLPESVESHFYLGAALMAQGQTSDAAESFRRAAEITPDFAQAQYYLAQCQTKLGVTEGAIVSLRRAVAAKPDFAAAHLALARLLRMRGETDEARRHVEATLAVAPGDAEARKMLSELGPRDGGK
jgi:tetratricopeptide (TPR) repeat protein